MNYKLKFNSEIVGGIALVVAFLFLPALFAKTPSILADIAMYLAFGVILVFATFLVAGFCSLLFGRYGAIGITLVFGYGTMPRLIKFLQSHSEQVFETRVFKKYYDGLMCHDGWISGSRGSGACSYHGGAKSKQYYELEKLVEVSKSDLFFDLYPFLISFLTLTVLWAIQLIRGPFDVLFEGSMISKAKKDWEK